MAPSFDPGSAASRSSRRTVPLDAALKRNFATVAEIGPGIVIEDKTYSIALHYRLAPDLENVVKEAVARICAENPLGID